MYLYYKNCCVTIWLLIRSCETCIDILKRTDSNQPDYTELKKAIAALEEVMTLVVNCCFVSGPFFLSANSVAVSFLHCSRVTCEYVL